MLKRLTDSRKGFLKQNRGGKLIGIEAIVLGFIILFIMYVNNYKPLTGLIVSFVVAFVFPWLVGTISALAWIATILFSFLWGIMAYFTGEAIFKGSLVAALFSGLLFFIISFAIHIIYLDLRVSKMTDLLGNITNNKSNKSSVNAQNKRISTEQVLFCPKCGRRIRSSNRICNDCAK